MGDSGTRLLLREPLAIPERAGYAWVLWDPMHFVMEQRLLQGIKERAEARPFVPPVVAATARVGWALGSVALLGLFVSQRRWRPWLLVPIGLAVPSLWLTGDMSAAMAAFLAVGITIAGFVACGWRWCAPYLLIASGVALVLLLAPDSYTAFGLIFLALTGAAAVSRRQTFGDFLRPVRAARPYAHG
jgi:hypothetical protein